MYVYLWCVWCTCICGVWYGMYRGVHMYIFLCLCVCICGVYVCVFYILVSLCAYGMFRGVCVCVWKPVYVSVHFEGWSQGSPACLAGVLPLSCIPSLEFSYNVLQPQDGNEAFSSWDYQALTHTCFIHFTSTYPGYQKWKRYILYWDHGKVHNERTLP